MSREILANLYGFMIYYQMVITHAGGMGGSAVTVDARDEAAEEKTEKEVLLVSVITMKLLLEAGVHFGPQTRRWNPKMATYIYMEAMASTLLTCSRRSRSLTRLMLSLRV